MTPISDPRITELWHPTFNGELTPVDVSRCSHKKVWWRCEDGHEWEAPVYTVSNGCGCPYCYGRLPIPGKTDLRTTHPMLAAEWDKNRNGSLKPEDVTRGSEKRVWWRCEKGHSYEAVVFSRVAGTTCPYCTGKKVLEGFNDLQTTNPSVVEQWFYPLNEDLLPTQVTKGSHKKVWWRCREGHIWQAAIYTRTRLRASGCPVCAGKIEYVDYHQMIDDTSYRFPDTISF